jgi:hypothetical protein
VSIRFEQLRVRAAEVVGGVEPKRENVAVMTGREIWVERDRLTEKVLRDLVFFRAEFVAMK